MLDLDYSCRFRICGMKRFRHLDAPVTDGNNKITFFANHALRTCERLAAESDPSERR